ncbi:MAG: hypothetical protein V1844_12015 [Pseudomonadota bacterium]
MESNKIAIRRLVDLELAVAALYNLFANRYIEDREFWIVLKDEEIQHARLLIQFEIDQSESPDGVSIASPVSGDVVKIMIERIHSLLDDIDNQVKSRKEACFIALQVEQSAGEFHFQAVASEFNKKLDNDYLSQLLKDDIDHVDRIQKYLHRVFL